MNRSRFSSPSPSPSSSPSPTGGGRPAGHRTVKWLVWAGLGLTALVLTGLAGLAALLVEAAEAFVSSGALREAGQEAARLPLPTGLTDWLAAWFGPAWIEGLRALQTLLAETLRLGGDALPLLGQAIGWLTWVVWGVWALVMGALLLAGLRFQILVNEGSRATAPHQPHR